jgi:LysM repeat protein
MSAQQESRHRKPGAPTQIRALTVRAAAIGAVAVPGVMMATHAIGAVHPVAQSQQETSTGTAHTGTAVSEYAQSDDVAAQTTVHEIPHPWKSQATAPTAKSTATTATKTAATTATKKPAAGAKTAAAKMPSPEYTVREGDTLSGIAQDTLGSGDRYTEIFDLNKDRAEPSGARFTDPNVIEPGWTLALPAGGRTTVVTAASDIVKRDSATPAVSSSATDRATGDLNDWINRALTILHAHGYSVSYHAIYETVMNESSGDPRAVNNYDSNAAAGHPSIGLMQTIQPTFDEYALPGYRDIYNPVDNIIAGARYAAAVYGSLDEVVAARCDGSCWRGY